MEKFIVGAPIQWEQAEVGISHTSQRGTSPRSPVDVTGWSLPAVKLGQCATGLNAWTRIICPRCHAEIGEKNCIDSSRLKVVLYQQRLRHRDHNPTRPRKLQTVCPVLLGGRNTSRHEQAPHRITGWYFNRPKNGKRKSYSYKLCSRPPHLWGVL